MLSLITNFTYKIEEKAAKSNFVYNLASKYYQEIVKKEAMLANISKEDHILCIGGGICPFTAILFNKLTGARVSVIDNNIDCVQKAKVMIHRQNLSDKIKIFLQDGTSSELDFSKYTVVHCALQVSPIADVIESIQEQMPLGARLMVRRPKKQLSPMYCKCNYILGSCAYVTHSLRNIEKTAIYIKTATKSDVAA